MTRDWINNDNNNNNKTTHRIYLGPGPDGFTVYGHGYKN